MQARLIAYPPDNPAIARWLKPGARLRLGRARDCNLAIDHPTVSRHHAELDDDACGWILHDLDSKNGSFVDGRRVDRATPLGGQCWLRFGDVHCELRLFAPEDAERLRQRERQRQALSSAMTRRIVDADPHFGLLLHDVLSGVVDITGCDRGFLLVSRDGELSVHTSCGLESDASDARAFAGSVGAVQRVLAQRDALIVNHVAGEPWLAGRASVADMHLHSLVCVPLLDGERILGVVYADRRKPGEPITGLDLDLLQAFCERAAVWLLAGRAIDEIETAPRWNTIVSQLADEAPA